jgi:hypothetical protein
MAEKRRKFDRDSISQPTCALKWPNSGRASSGTNVHATNTTFVVTPVGRKNRIAPNNHFSASPDRPQVGKRTARADSRSSDS